MAGKRGVPRRDWADPATFVGIVLLLAGLAMVATDRLDEVWFGAAVTFSPWPETLIGCVVLWFLGIRIGRAGDAGESER